MLGARLFVLALLVAAAASSVLLLGPTGAQAGPDGDRNGEAVIVFHSTDFIETRGAASADAGDLLAGSAVQRAETEARGRTIRPASSWPIREPDGGEYVDPLADHLASPLGGLVSDVGEFEDPDDQGPAPLVNDNEGVSDVGEYLPPEEGA